MKRDKFDILIKKYQNGTLKDSERELMDQWFNSLDSEEHYHWTEAEQERLYQSILAETDLNRKSPDYQASNTPMGKKWVPFAAAIVLITSIVGLLYYINNYENGNQLAATGDALPQPAPEEILPGTNKATLTLVDGRTVTLSEHYSEIVIGDGEIRYDDGSSLFGGNLQEAESTYATLTVPRGGEYQIVLPDGSKVWLNSASTLKYPLQFRKSERLVELEGEAYFDIAHQQNASGERVPFLVKTPAQTVEVLGTKFNIAAYADEQETRTTLVSGQIRVTRSDTREINILNPGEQAVISANPGIQIHSANIAAATAWTSGIFYFDETPFQAMMKPISRWYDIEVIYEGVAPDEVFSGKMSRNVNLGILLEFLKDSGINFKIQGKKLIVKKKYA